VVRLEPRSRALGGRDLAPANELGGPELARAPLDEDVAADLAVERRRLPNEVGARQHEDAPTLRAGSVVVSSADALAVPTRRHRRRLVPFDACGHLALRPGAFALLANHHAVALAEEGVADVRHRGFFRAARPSDRAFDADDNAGDRPAAAELARHVYERPSVQLADGGWKCRERRAGGARSTAAVGNRADTRADPDPHLAPV